MFSSTIEPRISTSIRPWMVPLDSLAYMIFPPRITTALWAELHTVEYRSSQFRRRDGAPVEDPQPMAATMMLSKNNLRMVTSARLVIR